MEKLKSKAGLPAFMRGSKKSAPEMKSSGSAWSGMNLVKKIMLILLSLLCAMLLWGYVLLAQNPDRSKQFTGIEVKLESGSEADLLYKNLMVYGGVANSLSDVTVTVTAPLADITKLTASDITATVSFNDVHSSGTARLVVRAASKYGSVVDIEPAFIDVDIDEITTRILAVDTEISGELQQGYWHGTASVSPKTVTVKGARRDIERISSAICEIDLSELTEPVNRSYSLLITDDEGNVFDQSKLIESIPAVNVQMQVYPYKTVDIIYSIADELPDGLEITEQSLNISSVNIACESNQLAKLLNIAAESVYVGNITQPGVFEFTLALAGVPDDAIIIDNPNLRSVKLTLVVEEQITEINFENVNITVTGKQTGFVYTYFLYDENGELGSPLVRLSVPVSITGKGSAAAVLKPSDFVLLLDVSALGEGSYDVPLRLVWNQLFTSLTDVSYPPAIHVEIAAAQP